MPDPRAAGSPATTETRRDTPQARRALLSPVPLPPPPHESSAPTRRLAATYAVPGDHDETLARAPRGPRAARHPVPTFEAIPEVISHPRAWPAIPTPPTVVVARSLVKLPPQPIAKPAPPAFVARTTAFADAEPTMIVPPIAPRPRAHRMAPVVRTTRTAAEHARSRLYLVLALLTAVLGPIAWHHALEQRAAGHAHDRLVRAELVVGALMTFVATAAIACGLTVVLVRG